ncbi:DUF1266 domain-containing protein [Fulvivirga maritima]|uniref:DUF1266 domain-containing protein n=1 Tax=Fulvivirga maritima TaxID=2904247 RepID=UPI001F209961|nr:DUF1266 domain-containing protein [Fulvivirga maritima]UII25117.1 DUF1266 domain-containing protein [Fulvivirga maritima]
MKQNIPSGILFNSQNADETVLATAKDKLTIFLEKDAKQLQEDLRYALRTWSGEFAHDEQINKLLFLSLSQQQLLLQSLTLHSPEYLKSKFIIENLNLFKTTSPKAFEADALAFRIQCAVVIDYLSLEEAFNMWSEIKRDLSNHYQSWNEYGTGYYIGQGLWLAHNNYDLQLPLSQTHSALTALKLQKNSPWQLNIWNEK